MCVSQAGGTSRWRQVSKGAGGSLAGNSDGGASVFVLEISGWPFAVDPAPHRALGRTAELLKMHVPRPFPRAQAGTGSQGAAPVMGAGLLLGCCWAVPWGALSGEPSEGDSRKSNRKSEGGWAGKRRPRG